MKINSLCVYCGARSKVAAPYRRAAENLGLALGSRGITLVYGGGNVGLMGICADAALSVGGRVVGVIPEHLKDIEVGHTGLSALHTTPDMHSRKAKMFELSDAFVMLPGGLGTLDEIFEIITWKQIGLHGKPVVVLNAEGYWQPFLDLVDWTIAQGFATAETRDLFMTAETVEDVFTLLEGASETHMDPRTKLF